MINEPARPLTENWPYQQNNRPPLLTFIFIIGALMAYTLPWATAGSAALTFNAYDLAEWASLHPTARSENPPLLTSGFLRCQLVIITWIGVYSLTTHRSSRLYGLGIASFIGLMILIQLPPLEFLQSPQDGNYRQQLGLAVVTGIGGLLIVSRGGRGQMIMLWLLTSVGLLTSVLGFARALTLMHQFSLDVAPGGGAVAMLIVYGLLITFSGCGYIRQPRRAT